MCNNTYGVELVVLVFMHGLMEQLLILMVLRLHHQWVQQLLIRLQERMEILVLIQQMLSLPLMLYQQLLLVLVLHQQCYVRVLC